MTKRNSDAKCISLGKRLKASRIRAGITSLREASRIVGYSERKLALLEHGEGFDYVPPAVIVRLAKVYKNRDMVFQYNDLSPSTEFARQIINEKDQEITAIYEKFRDTVWSLLDELSTLTSTATDHEKLKECLAEIDKVYSIFIRTVYSYQAEFLAFARRI